jgi:hypothetical protein
MNLSAKIISASVCSVFLAAFSNVAHAQSNVQIFGELDASVGSYKQIGGSSASAVASGSGNQSHMGFRGAEDLGNGLSAIFTFRKRKIFKSRQPGFNLGINRICFVIHRI